MRSPRVLVGRTGTAGVAARRVAGIAAVAILAGVGGVRAQTRAPTALSFAGTGELGTSIELRVDNGPPASVLTVVLSPQIGRVVAGPLRTDCFGAVPGLALLDVALDPIGSRRVALPLPAGATALVGRYLVGQAFSFTAPVGVVPPSNCASFGIVAPAVAPSILETFDSASGQQSALGACRWSTDVRGALLPGPLGGSARLGHFDHTVGRAVGGGVFEFDTDDQLFPATVTRSGAPIRVTDGVFEFFDFVVPAGIVVRFVGSRAARIHVAGAARIDGVLDASAPDVERASGDPLTTAGQPGGTAGPGGAAGGAGGDAPSGIPGVVDPNGRPGGDLRSVPGSPSPGLVIGSGGRGSDANPPGADPAAVVYAFATFFSNQFSSGGGGGGHVGPGAAAEVLAQRAPGTGVGPVAAGGNAVVPARVTRGSLARLLGGAGGGGGGVHAYDSVAGLPVQWVRGSAGAGGGGALRLAVGGDLVLGASGAIHCDGGSTADRDHDDGLLLAPGGAGAGGTVLLQVGGRIDNRGQVTARGGTGGRTEDLRLTPGTAVRGGDGGPGRVLVEATVAPSVAAIGRVDPPPDRDAVGALQDVDSEVTAVSTWRRLPTGADPTALRYAVHTVQNGVPVLYSDAAGTGSGPVVRGVTPIVLATRFAELDASGVPVPGAIGPWQDGSAVAPTAFPAGGIQFLVGFDRASGRNLRVEALRLSF